MRVAIIGAGNLGQALARAVSLAGHAVMVSASDPAGAKRVAHEVKVAAVSSNREAVQDADMVVLALPATAVADVLGDIGELIVDAVLVDCTNAVGEEAEAIMESAGSLAEATALHVPGTRVVKAFNTIFASRFNEPVVDGIPLDGFYAGDDAAAKKVVSDLLTQLGFRPVDTGDLHMARTLELMALLNMAVNARHGGSYVSGWKVLGSMG